MDTLNNNEIVELATKSIDILKRVMALNSKERKIKKAVIDKLYEDLEKIAQSKIWVLKATLAYGICIEDLDLKFPIGNIVKLNSSFNKIS